MALPTAYAPVSIALRVTATCTPLQDKALVFFLLAFLLYVISTSLHSLLCFVLISPLLITSFSFLFTCLVHPLAAVRIRIRNLEYRVKINDNSLIHAAPNGMVIVNDKQDSAQMEEIVICFKI
jgi:c-di-AMP phosphodiesterase-like protein